MRDGVVEGLFVFFVVCIVAVYVAGVLVADLKTDAPAKTPTAAEQRARIETQAERLAASLADLRAEVDAIKAAHAEPGAYEMPVAIVPERVDR